MRDYGLWGTCSGRLSSAAARWHASDRDHIRRAVVMPGHYLAPRPLDMGAPLGEPFPLFNPFDVAECLGRSIESPCATRVAGSSRTSFGAFFDALNPWVGRVPLEAEHHRFNHRPTFHHLMNRTHEKQTLYPCRPSIADRLIRLKRGHTDAREDAGLTRRPA